PPFVSSPTSSPASPASSSASSATSSWSSLWGATAAGPELLPSPLSSSPSSPAPPRKCSASSPRATAKAPSPSVRQSPKPSSAAVGGHRDGGPHALWIGQVAAQPGVDTAAYAPRQAAKVERAGQTN